ncbi:tyrosine-type recombinase/integrase [Streptomyces sp. NPDC008238]
MHALRHFYASVLLDSGESVKAVSEYMGHADPAMTLRVYVHLMPNSRERSRRAVDRVLGPSDVEDHGPWTAQSSALGPWFWFRRRPGAFAYPETSGLPQLCFRSRTAGASPSHNGKYGKRGWERWGSSSFCWSSPR